MKEKGRKVKEKWRGEKERGGGRGEGGAVKKGRRGETDM